MRSVILPAIILVLCVGAFSQPCTKKTAHQTVGTWATQKPDNLALADRSFSRARYPAVLAKAQKVIELLKLANPEFKGIQAYAYLSIHGQPLTQNGAVPFRVDAVYDSFICVGNDSHKVEARGKVLLNGVTNWTTVNFNSFGRILESAFSGNPFLTVEGEEIFEFPKQLGELRGFSLLGPVSRTGERHEAMIIASGAQTPYKPVTREQYLRARIKIYQDRGGDSIERENLASAIENLSTADRQSPAIVRDYSALPGRAKLFAAESDGSKRLVTIDKSFFNAKLHRETIQLIAISWSWNDKDLAKAEMIRLFKQEFDFEALSQMLGK